MHKNKIAWLTLLLVIGCGGYLSLSAQKPETKDANELSRLLEQRLGKADERRSWMGTALDYKLSDGKTFTLMVNEDGKVWGGLKLDLSAQIGKQIEVRGTYLGPGKEASFVRTEDGQTIYLNLIGRGGQYPEKLNFGDSVNLKGTLLFRPGSPSKRADVAGVGADYHIDDPVITR